MSVKALAFTMCLLLLFSNASAETYNIVGSFTQNNLIYNDYQFVLSTIDQSSKPNVEGQIQDGTVTGNGLTISGLGQTDKVNNQLKLTINSTTVDHSFIAINGYFPANSVVTIQYTDAHLNLADGLFRLQGLHLEKGAVLQILRTTATWSDANKGGYVVDYGSGGESVDIKTNSALYIINAVATNATGILRIPSTLTVQKKSALTIDYTVCRKCSKALAVFALDNTVQDESILRFTQTNVTDENKNSLLEVNGNIVIDSNSLFVIENCNLPKGSMINLNKKTFSVKGTSKVLIRDLTVSTSGGETSAPIPTSIEENSDVYGGNSVIGGTAVATVEGYLAKGITVTKIVDKDGKTSGTCSFADCIPGAYDNTEGGDCICSCQQGFNIPMCTATVDPLQDFIDRGSQNCYAHFCKTCEPMDASKCSECEDNYIPADDGNCKKPTPPGCNILFCKTCNSDAEPQTCSKCQDGYVLKSPTSCVQSRDGTAAIPNVLLMLNILFLLCTIILAM